MVPNQIGQKRIGPRLLRQILRWPLERIDENVLHSVVLDGRVRTRSENPSIQLIPREMQFTVMRPYIFVGYFN